MSTGAWPPPEPEEGGAFATVAAPAEEAEARPRRRFRLRHAAVAAAVAGVAVGGIALGFTANATSTTVASTTTTVQDAGTADSSTPTLGTAPNEGATTPGLSGGPGSRGGSDSTWPGTEAYSGSGTSSQSDATDASDAESTGIVIIETELGYNAAEAAGTGMVLTSDGLVLTNNHVVEDSTSITVTIASTGETYTATVVGTDAADDVALLQLDGASGLTTVALDDDGDPAVGDDVTAVGNASGGGVLLAADGSVTALESSVTTASEYTMTGETLDGMIEFEADVVSGDSGGALLDAEGEVVGMTTAASSGLATTIAYAIPIEDALAIVDQIQAGDESDGVEIGYPAFLGVALGGQSQFGAMPGSQSGLATGSGAQIGYVYADTPAASAGLVAGDVITAVDGTTVTSGDELAAALGNYEPGDSVTLTWTDTSGATQSATVTLIEGPAA